MNKFYFYKKIFFIILVFLCSCKKDTINWNLKKLPHVTELKLISNDLQFFEIEANCDFDGYDNTTEKGFCISVNPSPDVNDIIIIITNKGKGKYTSRIEWANSNKLYIRAYSKNEIGIYYSEELSVNWKGGNNNLPIVITNTVTNIGFNSAKLSATISSDGGLPILKSGFCISLNPNPSITNSSLILNQNLSNYNFYTFNNSLNSNTTYYLKAFAENLAGISYGDEISFQTKKIYNIGEIGPAGGFIFYFKNDTIDGWNFLEMAPSDVSSNIAWHPTNIAVTGINQTDIGSGERNTNTFINYFGVINNSAFGQTKNFNLNGFNDWFLPSRDELNLIRLNLLGLNLGSISQNMIYWSSSEDSFFTQNAWGVTMNNNPTGNIATYNKLQQLKVRPIRKF